MDSGLRIHWIDGLGALLGRQECLASREGSFFRWRLLAQTCFVLVRGGDRHLSESKRPSVWG